MLDPAATMHCHPTDTHARGLRLVAASSLFLAPIANVVPSLENDSADLIAVCSTDDRRALLLPAIADPVVDSDRITICITDGSTNPVT